MSNEVITLSSYKSPIDSINTSSIYISLHEGAINYLFEHFYTLRRIFSNVLGQMETDYLSIAFINSTGKIYFLSSCPSIEQNMIDKNIWLYDGSYNKEFIYQNNPGLWSDLYHSEYAQLIYRYKQTDLKLISGISIPYDYLEYRTVLSFGFRTELSSNDPQFLNQVKKLTAMGAFCLQEIKQSIPMLDKVNIKKPKNKLKLIFNNKTLNENFAR